MRTIKNLVIIGGVLVLLASVIGTFISFSNREVLLRNNYKQKIDERTAFYDKMYKIVAQKTQIAVKNDASFKEVVDIQMQGQKNGENVAMAWIQQSNPAATFTEVSAMYKDLSNVIEGERLGFFEQEKFLMDVVRQHDNLLDTFPGSLYNVFLNRPKLDYKPIQSSTTQEVMKTGIDNNVKLEL